MSLLPLLNARETIKGIPMKKARKKEMIPYENTILLKVGGWASAMVSKSLVRTKYWAPLSTRFPKSLKMNRSST